MDHGSLPLKVMMHIFPLFHSLISRPPYFFLSPSPTRGYGEHHKLVQWSCAANDFGAFTIEFCVLKADFSAKYDSYCLSMCLQMSFVTNSSAADTQPLVELVLEAHAEVIVHVTDVDSVVLTELISFLLA